MTWELDDMLDDDGNLKGLSRDQIHAPNRILWETIWACKTREDFLNMQHAMGLNENALWAAMEAVEGLNGLGGKGFEDSPFAKHLTYFKARMLAFGIIRGMQQGTLLGTGSKGSTTTSPLLQYPSVKKLLLRKPVASSPDVCDALDKVQAELPWPKLLKKSPFWKSHAKNPTVKAAISNARKDAAQAAMDDRFLALVKSIGDAGSIFSDADFKVKERAVGKRRT